MNAEAAHLAVQVAALDARAPRRCARCCPAARRARAGCTRARTRCRASWSGSVARGARRRAPRRPPGRGAGRGTRGRAAAIVSPGTMIIRRSMTLRSSRTLPGHAYACSALVAARSSVLARRPYSRANSGHEVLGEQRDVLAPLAQRRHEDRDHVQAEVQVLAEPAGADLRRQVLVGGREHPHVDVDAGPCRRPARPPAPAARAAPWPASSGSCRRSRRGRSCRRRPTSNLPAPVGDRAGERAP